MRPEARSPARLSVQARGWRGLRGPRGTGSPQHDCEHVQEKGGKAQRRGSCQQKTYFDKCSVGKNGQNMRMIFLKLFRPMSPVSVRS